MCFHRKTNLLLLLLLLHLLLYSVHCKDLLRTTRLLWGTYLTFGKKVGDFVGAGGRELIFYFKFIRNRIQANILFQLSPIDWPLPCAYYLQKRQK